MKVNYRGLSKMNRVLKDVILQLANMVSVQASKSSSRGFMLWEAGCERVVSNCFMQSVVSLEWKEGAL